MTRLPVGPGTAPRIKIRFSSGIVRTTRDGRQNVNEVDPAALAKHRPWGASDMEIPASLIDATLRGLARLAAEMASSDQQRSKSA